MSKDTEAPPLGPTKRDSTLSATRALVSLAPWVGPIVSELIGQLIPDQRLARIEEFVVLLNDRLKHLEREELEKRFVDPINVDLFEDGAIQAGRALSRERKEHIASLVSKGISGDKKSQLEAKRLLKILDEIDDSQMILLASYLQKHRHGDYYETHKEILEAAHAHMGADQEVLDQDTLHEAAKAHLVRLGLLRPTFSRPKKGEVPEFDSKTGMLKASYSGIAPLGRLLLRHVGLAEDEDY